MSKITGKVCAKHPELNGLRYAYPASKGGNKCVGCSGDANARRSRDITALIAENASLRAQLAAIEGELRAARQWNSSQPNPAGARLCARSNNRYNQG